MANHSGSRGEDEEGMELDDLQSVVPSYPPPPYHGVSPAVPDPVTGLLPMTEPPSNETVPVVRAPSDDTSSSLPTRIRTVWLLLKAKIKSPSTRLRVTVRRCTVHVLIFFIAILAVIVLGFYGYRYYTNIRFPGQNLKLASTQTNFLYSQLIQCDSKPAKNYSTGLSLSFEAKNPEYYIPIYHDLFYTTSPTEDPCLHATGTKDRPSEAFNPTESLNFTKEVKAELQPEPVHSPLLIHFVDMKKFRKSTPIPEKVIKRLGELKNRYGLSISTFALPLSLFPHLVDSALYEPTGEITCLTSDLPDVNPERESFMDKININPSLDLTWLSKEEDRMVQEWDEVKKELESLGKLAVTLAPADGFLWKDCEEKAFMGTLQDGDEGWTCWLVSMGERRGKSDVLRPRDLSVDSELVDVGMRKQWK